MAEAQHRLPGAQVQIISGGQSGQTFEMKPTGTLIGREINNDIILSNPTISRSHARVFWQTEQGWCIEKQTASNTLTINQQPVSRAILQDHDMIGLGRETTLLFLIKAPVPAPVPAVQAFPQGPGNVAAQGPATPHKATIEVSLTPQVQSMGIRGTHIAPPLEDLDTSGAPLLEISTNTRPDKRVYQLDRPIINIGRDPSNEIVINEQTVSNFHAQIVREGNHLVLLHPHPRRQSTLNGLLYQGRKIEGNQQFRQELKRGDIFRIGDLHGTLITLTYNDGSGARQEVAPEIHPIPLDSNALTLGRLPGNSVVLNHPQVSAYHARLERAQGSYRLIDLGSSNHVYVNSHQVKEQLLKVGDEVRIGPFRLTYTGTQLIQRDEGSSIRIDAQHLNRYGSKNVLLLNDISLVIPPRKFVALVGGSGAGKSTLLNALSGLYPAQQGTVLYNGQDYYSNLAAFSSQLGYVPQDDIIHRELSVERALYYAARLRLPGDFTAAQIQQRIDDVLEDVEMKHRRHLLVNKLSGGQRKRVSIALELLANPSVFFLDEPTSGLDPGLDRKMMFLLRRLADRGHTIVLVTHATSNINVCDYVCFLAQGGRLAYFGPPNEARVFFDKSSFAEIYSALEPTEDQPNAPQQAEEHFLASPDYQRYVVQQEIAEVQTQKQVRTSALQQRKQGQPWRQFWLLSLRSVELLKNDIGNLLILLLQAPIIGLILFFMASSTTFVPQRIANCPTRADIQATTGPIVSTDCQRILDALNTPDGQDLLKSQGLTKEQFIQNSIAFGSGTDAQQILFIMAFAAVMFGCINSAREIVKEGPIYRRERTVNLGIL
ncbi:MAG TPA: FHA domain-containing protein, partial [Ktedonobacteraceae bacterium]|nr:FHA domain-containing protein [Ktedonobacteraceae bacterium]